MPQGLVICAEPGARQGVFRVVSTPTPGGRPAAPTQHRLSPIGLVFLHSGPKFLQFFVVLSGECSSIVGSPGIDVAFSYHMITLIPTTPVADGGSTILPCPDTPSTSRAETVAVRANITLGCVCYSHDGVFRHGYHHCCLIRMDFF